MSYVRIPENFDSKFRYILVVAERAKQLLNGAPPRLVSKARKPYRMAMEEVAANLVKFETIEETEEQEETA